MQPIPLDVSKPSLDPEGLRQSLLALFLEHHTMVVRELTISIYAQTKVESPREAEVLALKLYPEPGVPKELDFGDLFQAGQSADPQIDIRFTVEGSPVRLLGGAGADGPYVRAAGNEKRKSEARKYFQTLPA